MRALLVPVLLLLSNVLLLSSDELEVWLFMLFLLWLLFLPTTSIFFALFDRASWVAGTCWPSWRAEMPLAEEVSTPTISVESSTFRVSPRSSVMLLLSWSTREPRPRMCCTLPLVEELSIEPLLLAIDPVVLDWPFALPMSLAVPVCPAL